VYVASGRFIIEAGKAPVVECVHFQLPSPRSMSRDLWHAPNPLPSMCWHLRGTLKLFYPSNADSIFLQVQDQRSGSVKYREKRRNLRIGDDGSCIASNCLLRSAFHSINTWRTFCSLRFAINEPCPLADARTFLLKSETPPGNPSLFHAINFHMHARKSINFPEPRRQEPSPS
jgi:hypothetical protein